MKYLLDTHALIWDLEADSNLPVHLKQIIDDISNEIFISMASLWEMTIKYSLGKLTLTKPLDIIFKHFETMFEILPITTEHLLTLESLPSHHRDPFDRIIIAQSIKEDIQLISKDQIFDKYIVNRIW